MLLLFTTSNTNTNKNQIKLKHDKLTILNVNEYFLFKRHNTNTNIVINNMHIYVTEFGKYIAENILSMKLSFSEKKYFPYLVIMYNAIKKYPIPAIIFANRFSVFLFRKSGRGGKIPG